MDHLDRLESQSIYIIREAFNRMEKIAMLWSLGKDSNVMIHLARKAFFGHVPFPVMHVDTARKFPEMYAFRDRYAKKWGLDFLRETCPPVEEIDPSLPPAARSAARKTAGLKAAVEKHGFTALFAGIRRDEEATRAKERVFSPRGSGGQWDVRDQPPEFWDQYKTDFPAGTHIRVHPLLHWTEHDIWAYTLREKNSGDLAVFCPGRQALPVAGGPGHHLSDGEQRGDNQGDSRRTPPDPAGRARRAGDGSRGRRQFRAPARRRLSLGRWATPPLRCES